MQSCGTVQRVTIPGDRQQHPKGYAYVEFLEVEAVQNALKLTNSEIGGRAIKISAKRTNEAGVARGRGGRAGARGRGRGRGRFMMPMPMMFDPSMMMCAAHHCLNPIQLAGQRQCDRHKEVWPGNVAMPACLLLL